MPVETRARNPRATPSSYAAVRCAIYTRKSTDEGLDQAFNTLDAQRDAAESFISSQRHEGWTVLPQKYDDGGFTGANMDRPALQRLLADNRPMKIMYTTIPTQQANTPRKWGTRVSAGCRHGGATSTAKVITISDRKEGRESQISVAADLSQVFQEANYAE